MTSGFRTRLIQRLIEPSLLGPREFANPYNRQSSTLSLSSDARDPECLGRVFLFDQMGAGEFEGGRQKAAIRHLSSWGSGLRQFSRRVAVREKPFHTGSPTTNVDVYFIVPDALASHAVRFVNYEAGFQSLSWRQVSLERATLFSESRFVQRRKISGWLSIDEQQPFFFSTSRQMAQGFSDFLSLPAVFTLAEKRPDRSHGLLPRMQAKPTGRQLIP